MHVATFAVVVRVLRHNCGEKDGNDQNNKKGHDGARLLNINMEQPREPKKDPQRAARGPQEPPRGPQEIPGCRSGGSLQAKVRQTAGTPNHPVDKACANLQPRTAKALC